MDLFRLILTITLASTLNSCCGHTGSQGDAGLPGAPGHDGSNGNDGHDGATGPQGPSGVAGAPGATGPAGPQGPSGTDGLNGAPGSNGSSGHSSLIAVVSADVSVCSNGGFVYQVGLDMNDNNTLDLSEVTSLATVCNGLNGADAGPAPLSPVSTIAPCGNTVAYKELLLCLSNGSLLASFSDNASGLNTRLALIPVGSYVDTDGSNCSFSVSVDSSSNTTVSWSGGSALCSHH